MANIRKRLTLLGAVLLILIVASLVTSYSSAQLREDETTNNWWSGWLQNLSSELIGALLTYALFELIIERREQRRIRESEKEFKKEALIYQLSSWINDHALAAAHELTVNDWLEDGSLRNKNFTQANWESGLLWNADLQDANLQHANLRNTVLYGSNLKGVDLRNADMLHTELREAKFDENTILPDGKKWSPETNMRQYTHPPAWQTIVDLFIPPKVFPTTLASVHERVVTDLVRIIVFGILSQAFMPHVTRMTVKMLKKITDVLQDKIGNL